MLKENLNNNKKYMRESAVQKAIEQYLQLMENQSKLVYIKNNSGSFVNKNGNFYRMGRPGSSDFIVAISNGITLWLEVKLPTTKQNENQILFEQKVKNLGHKYYVVRSVDEVVDLLKTYN